MPSTYLSMPQAATRASQLTVQGEMPSLISQLKSRRWIDPANAYAADIVTVIETQWNKASTLFTEPDLRQYVAASVPLHCLDGWSLLGRALESAARGDRESALHLAYYAELRAAVSMLASAGFGIFNNHHAFIDTTGQCLPLKPEGTHQVAWNALKEWANSADAQVTLARLIRAGGRSLSDWLDEFGAAPTRPALAREWLQGWGLDLEQFVRDRKLRNETSYRPSRLHQPKPLRVLEVARFVAEMWEILEPAGADTFESLDRFLIRLSLYQAQDAMQPGWRRSSRARARFQQRIGSTVRNLAPDGWDESLWVRFLLREVAEEDPPLISEWHASPSGNNARQHFGVIARALLLLRVATGVCSELITGSGLARRELRFWWRPLGEERGLWGPGSDPPDFVDLWQDVAEALEQVAEWQSDTLSPQTYASWLERQSGPISVFGGCERVGLWGMGL